MRRVRAILAGAAGLLGLVIMVWWIVSHRTEPVTRERLARARASWDAAGITSYDLRFRTSGARNGTYHVEVRDGQAVRIILDGRLANPAEKDFYTVEGLFRTIEEELELFENPPENAVPAGTQVWLRMRCDPHLGYPVRFIRQVPGANLGEQIHVLSVVPVQRM